MAKKEKTLFSKSTTVVHEELYLEEGGQIRVMPGCSPTTKGFSHYYVLKVPWTDRTCDETITGAAKKALKKIDEQICGDQEKIAELEKSIKNIQEVVLQKTEILEELQRYLDEASPVHLGHYE
jgi:hypothetical protein